MEYMEGGSLSEAAKKYHFAEEHIAYVGREVTTSRYIYISACSPLFPAILN